MPLASPDVVQGRASTALDRASSFSLSSFFHGKQQAPPLVLIVQTKRVISNLATVAAALQAATRANVTVVRWEEHSMRSQLALIKRAAVLLPRRCGHGSNEHLPDAARLGGRLPRLAQRVRKAAHLLF